MLESLWCRESSSDVDTKQAEHDKSESQPNTGGTADDQDRHARSHAVTGGCFAGQLVCWNNATRSAKRPSAVSGPRPARANLHSGCDFGAGVVAAVAVMGCDVVTIEFVTAAGGPSFCINRFG
jgi:hypothetical protein